MLQRLFIKNYLFIEELDLDLNHGLTVITGETGSGKSVLLNCIKLGLGGKISSSFPTQEDKEITIYLEFDIQNYQLISNKLSEMNMNSSNDNLSIRRVIQSNKRSKFYVNEFPATQNFVEELANNLLEYQGQHSQASILDQKNHILFLDQFASLEKEIEELNLIYKDLNLEKINLQKILDDIKNQEQEREYFEHVIKELDKIAPQEDEEHKLSQQRIEILNKKKIIDTLKISIAILEDNNVEHSILNAYKSISKISNVDDDLCNFEKELQRIDGVSIELSDILSNLHEKLALFDNLQDYSSIEDRIYLLRDAARKYRVSPNDLGKFYLETKEKLDQLQNLNTKIAEINKKITLKSENYFEKAKKISNSRIKAAQELENSIRSELASLKMDKTIFKIKIINDDKNLSPSGIDKVEFMVTNNPDLPLAPLKDISSGGELSRFMLAMRVVLTKLKSPPTIIFDEIDSGLGGAVADAVGEKLLKLSKIYQLLVITHHPQVAVKANNHILLCKKFSNEKTILEVKNLSKENKTLELARMLSGKEITDEAIQAAKQLLAN